MDNLTKKCEVCNKPLEESQYLSSKDEGEPVKKKLVCRNYPNCPRAEKEINK